MRTKYRRDTHVCRLRITSVGKQTKKRRTLRLQPPAPCEDILFFLSSGTSFTSDPCTFPVVLAHALSSGIFRNREPAQTPGRGVGVVQPSVCVCVCVCVSWQVFPYAPFVGQASTMQTLASLKRCRCSEAQDSVYY